MIRQRQKARILYGDEWLKGRAKPQIENALIIHYEVAIRRIKVMLCYALRFKCSACGRKHFLRAYRRKGVYCSYGIIKNLLLIPKAFKFYLLHGED